MTQEDERIARKLLDLTSRNDRVQIRNGMTYLDGYALGNGTVEISRQVVRDRRMRDVDFTMFLETFVIRIESPEVDDIHTLDPHQFWGVKVKDIQVVGGELELILRKEGEEDKALAKGGTVPKDWGLLVKVKAVDDEELPPGSTEEPRKVDVIVCYMLLEHKSGHRTGWEAIPFRSKFTDTGRVGVINTNPESATLLKVEGVSSSYNYLIRYRMMPGSPIQTILSSEIPEGGIEVNANGTIYIDFERIEGEIYPEFAFYGTALIKQKRKGKITEITALQCVTTNLVEDTPKEYVFFTAHFYPVNLIGLRQLSGANLRVDVESWDDEYYLNSSTFVDFFIRVEGEPDALIPFKLEYNDNNDRIVDSETPVQIPKGASIIIRVINPLPDRRITCKLIMER